MKRFYKLKTLLITIVIFTFGLNQSYAQVGIGNVSPQGALDISTLANPNADGLLIPRVALALTTTATILTPTVSEMVYNTATAGDVTPGFYFWDGAKWVRIVTGNVSNDWTNTGNAATTATTNFVGTTDAIDFVTRTNNTEKTRVTSAGNVGIGTPTPAAKLDVLASVTTVNSIVNATGSINDFLQYNVQNTSTGIQAQSGYSATADNGTATTGFAWLGINNSTFNFPTAYNIGGANDVSYIGSGQDMYIANANNTRSIIFSTGRAATPFFNERMRVLNDGRVGINNAAPATGDLFTVTSSATNTFAINGYSTGNGSGIYGAVSSGTTAFGGVQGQYFGSNTSGTGVRGTTNSTGIASSFSTSNSGLNGQLGNANNVFSFGVKGQSINNNGNQVGGVVGISNVTTTFGILGYRNSAGTLFGLYGSSAAGTGTGRNSASAQNNGIGLGAYGGFMGGFIKGSQYGLVSKGNEFGMYVSGNTVTNGPIIQLIGSNNKRIATYATTSTSVDITTRGKAKLIKGEAFVAFNEAFMQSVSSSELDKGVESDGGINITITPVGESNGVFVKSITNKGFYVKENSRGTSSVSFNWTAIGTKIGYEKGVVISDEILANDFDAKMDGVMNNESDANTQAIPIYFDGRKVRFEKMKNDTNKIASAVVSKPIETLTNEIKQ